MARRDAWKLLSPQEQLIDLVRRVNALYDVLRFYTRIQGVRLESRMVGTERRLYAVVEDSTASNDGVEYQIAP